MPFYVGLLSTPKLELVNNKTYLFYNSFFSNTLNKWNALAQETGEQNLSNQAESAYKALVKKEVG